MSSVILSPGEGFPKPRSFSLSKQPKRLSGYLRRLSKQLFRRSSREDSADLSSSGDITALSVELAESELPTPLPRARSQRHASHKKSTTEEEKHAEDDEPVAIKLNFQPEDDDDCDDESPSVAVESSFGGELDQLLGAFRAFDEQLDQVTLGAFVLAPFLNSGEIPALLKHKDLESDVSVQSTAFELAKLLCMESEQAEWQQTDLYGYWHQEVDEKHLHACLNPKRAMELMWNSDQVFAAVDAVLVQLQKQKKMKRFSFKKISEGM